MVQDLPLSGSALIVFPYSGFGAFFTRIPCIHSQWQQFSQQVDQIESNLQMQIDSLLGFCMDREKVQYIDDEITKSDVIRLNEVAATILSNVLSANVHIVTAKVFLWSRLSGLHIASCVSCRLCSRSDCYWHRSCFFKSDRLYPIQFQAPTPFLYL